MSLLRKGVKTPQILFFNLNPVLKDGASESLCITINTDTYPDISACPPKGGADRYVGDKNSKLNGIYTNFTFLESTQ